MTEDRLADGEPVVPVATSGEPTLGPGLSPEAVDSLAEAPTEEGVIATPAQFTRVREDKGWTVGEVAGRMRMQVRQIEAIEAGRWQDLPGTAFVRAAIRSYARLLDQDAAPLLASVAQLDTGLDLRSTTRAPVAISPTGSLGESSGIGRWGLALLGLLAVIAIAFYFAPGGDLRWPSQWFDGEGSVVDASSTIAAGGAGSTRTPPPPAPSPSDDAVAAAARAANELLGTRPGTDASAVDGAAAPADGGSPAGSRAAVQSGTSGAMPAEGPASSPAAGAGPVVAGAGSSVASDAAVAGATESAPAESASTPPADTPGAVTGASAATSTAAVPAATATATSLLMSFDAECWVEVTAAGNRRLVYGLQKPQTSLSLDAPGPLSILIGNADAVTLVRAGQPVDVKSAARDGVAKLRLE